MSEINRIKNLRLALKDLEPYVKDPAFLTQGKRFTNFNMLVREAWGNWLLCAVITKVTGELHSFQENPLGDGLIVNMRSNVTFPVEHVCAMDFPAGKQPPKGENRVLWAIKHKVDRGPEYATGKSLVVFFDGAGEFFRSKIRESILGTHNFKVIFCIGLLEITNAGYSYVVSEFRDSFGEKSLSHKVDINYDFTEWTVSQVMG